MTHKELFNYFTSTILKDKTLRIPINVTLFTGEIDKGTICYTSLEEGEQKFVDVEVNFVDTVGVTTMWDVLEEDLLEAYIKHLKINEQN